MNTFKDYDGEDFYIGNIVVDLKTGITYYVDDVKDRNEWDNYISIRNGVFLEDRHPSKLKRVKNTDDVLRAIEIMNNGVRL